jgi:hypothetical protein
MICVFRSQSGPMKATPEWTTRMRNVRKLLQEKSPQDFQCSAALLIEYISFMHALMLKVLDAFYSSDFEEAYEQHILSQKHILID